MQIDVIQSNQSSSSTPHVYWEYLFHEGISEAIGIFCKVFDSIQ